MSLSELENSPSGVPTSATNETFAKIADKQWEAVQKKTFTKWINSKLKVGGFADVNNVTTEFSNGVPLLQLLEIIGNESLGKFNRAPKLRIQKVENLNRAIEFIKHRGVPLTNIGAEDILDCNEKLVLGLIWIIILRFTIAEISEGDLTAKEGLLLWCQRKTAGYRDVSVKDFTFSFADGLALCALIHRHRPDLLDFNALDKAQKSKNVELAFSIAEKHLGIPRLLDVEDLADIPKPDERSVMTYVAQYFHAFSTLGKVETSGRRLGTFVGVVQSVWEMQHEYEKRVQTLINSLEALLKQWSVSTFTGSYADAKQQSNDLKAYKSDTKRQWVVEKRDLDGLLGNINTKLQTYNLKPYAPPRGLLSDLEECWRSLLAAETSRRRLINERIREIKETLQREYADLANAFQDKLNGTSSSLANLPAEAELSAQLDSINEIATRIPDLEASLPKLQACADKCSEAGIEENDYTVYAVDDLTFDLGLVKLALKKKTGFIENQMIARQKSNLTPQQLEEFENTFRHFDRDNSNSLSFHEFKAGLAGLGNYMEDAEIEATFKTVCRGGDSVNFEQFLEYMVSITEDRTTMAQLLDSFHVIANGKDHVTEMDMKVGQLDSSAIAFLTSQMPRSESKQDAYDFKTYLNSLLPK